MPIISDNVDNIDYCKFVNFIDKNSKSKSTIIYDICTFRQNVIKFKEFINQMPKNRGCMLIHILAKKNYDQEYFKILKEYGEVDFLALNSNNKKASDLCHKRCVKLKEYLLEKELTQQEQKEQISWSDSQNSIDSAQVAIEIDDDDHCVVDFEVDMYLNLESTYINDENLHPNFLGVETCPADGAII